MCRAEGRHGCMLPSLAVLRRVLRTCVGSAADDYFQAGLVSELGHGDEARQVPRPWIPLNQAVSSDRDGQIRTGDPLLPKQVRYQAAPRPVAQAYRTGALPPEHPAQACSGEFARRARERAHPWLAAPAGRPVTHARLHVAVLPDSEAPRHLGEGRRHLEVLGPEVTARRRAAAVERRRRRRSGWRRSEAPALLRQKVARPPAKP
jgi:hypothetical protein